MEELERDVYGEFPYSFHKSWIVDEYLASFYILHNENELKLGTKHTRCLM